MGLELEKHDDIFYVIRGIYKPYFSETRWWQLFFRHLVCLKVRLIRCCLLKNIPEYSSFAHDKNKVNIKTRIFVKVNDEYRHIYVIYNTLHYYGGTRDWVILPLKPKKKLICHVFSWDCINLKWCLLHMRTKEKGHWKFQVMSWECLMTRS